MVIFSSSLTAQEEPYGFTFAPDLWYNDVDGIRTGIRVFGEVEGTFKDGSHRLDAGLWLGTWLPENPVSYYLSFIEPIKAISDYGNEGSIQFISSIRTGYSQHKVQFNKRWQPSFNEYDFKEVAVYFSQEKMFDSEYRAFPQLWETNSKSLIGIDFKIRNTPDIGDFVFNSSVVQVFSEKKKDFYVVNLEAIQKIELNEFFNLNVRLFAGYSINDVAPEYAFSLSMNSAHNWVNKGLSRAKGTIPQPWLEAGSFQVGGGANLRGYLNRDINALNQGLVEVFQEIISSNIELNFWNPIDDRIKKISIVGDFVDLKTYLFFDVGVRGNNHELRSEQDPNVNLDSGVLADAGLGLQFSINIPDYLGKDRGIFIRYDIPFWLSDIPDSESNFSFRQLIGLGAIISF